MMNVLEIVQVVKNVKIRNKKYGSLLIVGVENLKSFLPQLFCDFNIS